MLSGRFAAFLILLVCTPLLALLPGRGAPDLVTIACSMLVGGVSAALFTEDAINRQKGSNR